MPIGKHILILLFLLSLICAGTVYATENSVTSDNYYTYQDLMDYMEENREQFFTDFSTAPVTQNALIPYISSFLEKNDDIEMTITSQNCLSTVNINVGQVLRAIMYMPKGYIWKVDKNRRILEKTSTIIFPSGITVNNDAVKLTTDEQFVIVVHIFEAVSPGETKLRLGYAAVVGDSSTELYPLETMVLVSALK